MSLSKEDLQNYIGQNVDSVKTELEGHGYKVYLGITGRFLTGGIRRPPKVFGEEPQKCVIILFNGDDPERKVESIREIDD